MMQIDLLNEQGQAVSKLDVPETVFGREYNEALVHQLVVAYQQMPVKGLVRKKIARRFAILLKSLFVKKERVTLALV